jgi:PPOX class F420-dependent enzyme/OxyR family protein
MAFTEEEAAYLTSQPLARIATVGPDGQPDVAPVGFEFDGTYLYVGGRAPERTRKFLNVKAGQAKVALVVDDPQRGPQPQRAAQQPAEHRAEQHAHQAGPDVQHPHRVQQVQRGEHEVAEVDRRHRDQRRADQSRTGDEPRDQAAAFGPNSRLGSHSSAVR